MDEERANGNKNTRNRRELQQWKITIRWTYTQVTRIQEIGENYSNGKLQYRSDLMLDQTCHRAELLLNPSIFVFSQHYQPEKMKEMYNKVIEDVIAGQLPEESECIKKFKRKLKIAELILWFSTRLDASDQQELIGGMVHVKAHNKTISNEDLKLKRFTRLCRDYTDYVLHLQELIGGMVHVSLPNN